MLRMRSYAIGCLIALIALIGCNGFFLPYQSTTYLALYSGTNG